MFCRLYGSNNISTSNLAIAGNGFGQTYLSANGALVLNPGYGGVGMAGVNQYITLGYINGQTAGTTLTGSFTGSFKGDGVNLTGVTASYLNSSALIFTAVSESGNYADDAAAAAGGVQLGGIYRNGNFIQIRLV
jgi:hypothetical protein